MDQAPTGRKKEIIAALSVLLVVVVIVAMNIASKKKAPALMGTTTVVNTTSTTGTSRVTTQSSTYKDGSYSAIGTYESPGGEEQLGVQITLKNNVVTATSAQAQASDPQSDEYEAMFISGYKKLVVGKNINDISLSRVSGSSLTSQGFNNALQQIKQQAQA